MPSSDRADPRARLRLPDASSAHLWIWESVGEPASALSGSAKQRLARAYLGVSATVGRRCPCCGSIEHGSPVITPSALTMSVSHSHVHLVVLAVKGAVFIGVDAEDLPARPWSHSMMGRLLTRREAASMQRCPTPDRCRLAMWTRKEALVKAGVGSLTTASQLESGWHEAVRREREATELTTLTLPNAVVSLALPRGLTPVVIGDDLGLPLHQVMDVPRAAPCVGGR